MKSRTISGKVCEPIWHIYQRLKKELNAKTHGDLLTRLIHSYSESQAIIRSYQDGELKAVNPDTVEDRIEQMIEASKSARKLPHIDIEDVEGMLYDL